MISFTIRALTKQLVLSDSYGKLYNGLTYLWYWFNVS